MKHCTKTVYFVTNVYACVVYPRVRACECIYVCVCVSCNEKVYVYVWSHAALRTILLFKLTGKCLRLKIGGGGGGDRWVGDRGISLDRDLNSHHLAT